MHASSTVLSQIYCTRGMGGWGRRSAGLVRHMDETSAHSTSSSKAAAAGLGVAGAAGCGFLWDALSTARARCMLMKSPTS